jgi:transposase
VCDALGNPIHCEVTAGQDHETTAFEDLLSNAPALDAQQEQLIFPLAVAGDKGYDAAWIRQWLEDFEIEPVIPRRSHDEATPDEHFDRQAYRRRNVIERLIGWIKECRRIFSRFEKTATNFLAMIRLAFIQRYLKSIV